MSVYQEKRGMVEPDEEGNERMRWGQRLESAVLAGYSEDTGIKIRRGRFRRAGKHPHMVGHIDAEADDRMVEVKATHHVGPEWTDGPQGVPPKYYAQVQHYMVVGGYALCDMAVLERGNKLHIIPVEADEDFQAVLIEQEWQFWTRVTKGEPPPPDGSASSRAALKRLYPMDDGSEVIGTREADDNLLLYMGAREKQKEANKLAAQRRRDKVKGMTQGMTKAETVIPNESNTVIPLTPAEQGMEDMGFEPTVHLSGHLPDCVPSVIWM